MAKFLSIMQDYKNNSITNYLISQSPCVLPCPRGHGLFGVWDARKFIQKNFLYRKCSTFSCDPKLKTVYTT